MSEERERAKERERIGRRTAVEELWRMPWADFEVMLGLRNSLSLRSYHLGTLERSGEYLRHCGFDVSRIEACRVFGQFFADSLFFIRHVLMNSTERVRFRVPSRLLHLDDPRLLLVYASDRAPRHRYLRLWACGAVKVLFAIASLEYSDKLRDIDVAREQIFGRIKSLISARENGSMVLSHGGISVPLFAIDWKEAKTRTSILLKLLHKPESALDEVFDYLGVRFVTRRESELPLLLKILVQSDIVLPHQVLAGRSRNTLFNIGKSKSLAEILLSLSSMDSVDAEELNSMFERVPWTFRNIIPAPRHRNVFSSSDYRSLQITVRHLVRLPNPAHLVVVSLLRQIRHYRGLDRDASDVSSLVPQETARYFPIEIQVMDAAAYELAKFGSASHEQYKAAQLKVVRERVLAGMLGFSEDKLSTQEI